MPDGQYEKLARGALLEITDEASIGALIGEQIESDGAVSVIFASVMRGYPGWNWTVSIAQVEGAEPTVLEAELMPAEGALLSPDWVPWSERLAEYKAAQAATEAVDAEKAESEKSASDGESGDEDSDYSDDDDDDDDDDDAFDSGVLHGGDLDGVDIDESNDDESEDDDDADDDSDDDDDDDDDSDDEEFDEED
jgi:hypothetical protein